MNRLTNQTCILDDLRSFEVSLFTVYAAAASSASGELSGRAASFTSFFQGGADSAREDAKGEGKETKVEMEGDEEKGKEKEDPNAPRSYQAAVGGTGASAPAAAAPAAANLQTQEEDGMVYTRI